LPNVLVSQSRADFLDARAARDRERRHAASQSLRLRSAPAAEVVRRWEAGPPPPAAVEGISLRAAIIIAIVAAHIVDGADGIQVGGAELAAILGCSVRSVWSAVLELRTRGLLQRVRDSVPAEETALGGAYVTLTAAQRRAHARAKRQGLPRNVRTDRPGAYTRSTIRNLYTLGHAALRAGLGRPRRPVDNSANRRVCTATSLPLSSESGYPTERSELRSVGPVDLWTTRPIQRGAEPEISAPGGEDKESLRDGSSLRSSPTLRESIEASPPAPRGGARAAPCVAGAVELDARAAAATPEEEASMERSGGQGGGRSVPGAAAPTTGGGLRPAEPDPEAGLRPAGKEPSALTGSVRSARRVVRAARVGWGWGRRGPGRRRRRPGRV
jgi:hypothetical protein